MCLADFELNEVHDKLQVYKRFLCDYILNYLDLNLFALCKA